MAAILRTTVPRTDASDKYVRDVMPREEVAQLRRDGLVVEEQRRRVLGGALTLFDDDIRGVNLERGRQLGALCVLDAVCGPQELSHFACRGWHVDA